MAYNQPSASFHEFVERALNAKQTIHWNDNDPNDSRPVIVDDAEKYNLSTRSWFQTSPMITEVNQPTGWKIPVNRWLQKSGAYIHKNEEFYRYDHLGVASITDIPTVWLPEGNSITLVEPVTGVAQAIPGTVATGIEFSRHSKHKFYFDLPEWLQANMQVAFEKAIQSAVLVGNGAAVGEIAGILSVESNLAGTFTDTSGVSFQIAEAYEAIIENGAIAPFIVAAAGVRRSLMSTFINGTGSEPAWKIYADGTETCLGVPAAVDTGLPALTAVMGDFSSAHLFMPTSLDVRYNVASAANTAKMYGFMDAALVINPSRYAKLTFSA